MSSIFRYGVDHKVRLMDKNEWTRHDARYGIKFYVVAGSSAESGLKIETATQTMHRAARCFLVRSRIVNSKFVLLRNLHMDRLELHGEKPPKDHQRWPYCFYGRIFRLAAWLHSSSTSIFNNRLIYISPKHRARHTILKACMSLFDLKDAPESGGISQ